MAIAFTAEAVKGFDMSYQPCIISFIDILGFRNLVAERTEAELRKILKTLRKITKPDTGDAVLFPRRFAHFSDTAIRTTNILSAANTKYPPVGIVFYELLDLIWIQHDLLCQGVFIRGAVTIGEIRMGSGLTYGPGLIEAYQLEKDRAKHPRIIVSEDLLQGVREIPLLKSFQHSAEEEMEHIKGLLSYDKGSNLHFLDYLRVMAGELEDFETYRRFLAIHKRHVEDGLDRSQGCLKTLRKYRWLARYHNRIVRMLPKESFCNAGYGKDSIKIALS